MRRSEIGICAAAAAAACILTGCSMLDRVVGADDWKSWKPTMTTLQVYQDGSLTETIIDTLDQSYYNADELQDMVARSVRLYNEEAGTDALTVTEYAASQQDLKLVIQYASGEDYRSYNQLVFFDGSVLEAEMEGFLFANSFRRVERGKVVQEEVPDGEALAHKEYRVTITDSGHAVQVPGKICYVSVNAEPVNSHAARPLPEKTEEKAEKETDEGLVLPSSAVYRKPETVTETEKKPEISGEERDRSYIYVLYEKDPVENGGDMLQALVNKKE